MDIYTYASRSFVSLAGPWWFLALIYSSQVPKHLHQNPVWNWRFKRFYSSYIEIPNNKLLRIEYVSLGAHISWNHRAHVETTVRNKYFIASTLLYGTKQKSTVRNHIGILSSVCRTNCLYCSSKWKLLKEHYWSWNMQSVGKSHCYFKNNDRKLLNTYLGSYVII